MRKRKWTDYIREQEQRVDEQLAWQKKVIREEMKEGKG